MRKYSDFFQTLHDEQNPTGYLGRGTHYSILRAVVFHDAMGEPLQRAQFADFAVIWDEDHDDRVIEPIEKIYRRGLLPHFLMFGERKGGFTAVLANNLHDPSRLSDLEEKINRITQRLDTEDSWPARVVGLESSENSIISASSEKVTLYLNNLEMLWELGVKAPSIEETLFNPLLLRKVDELQLSRWAANSLKNGRIAYVGDLVKKSEAEMLRSEGFGRKSLNEINDALASLGLHLGMEAPGWPPKSVENIFRRSKEINTRSVAEG